MVGVATLNWSRLHLTTDDWSVNWGYGNDKDWNVADSFNKIGTNGGGNIWVPAGTYAVYLNDITNSMLIIAQ